MKSRLPPRARMVGIYSYTRYPGQPVARKNERPRVALFARHASVNEDVLKLPCSAPAKRAHSQTRPAKSNTDIMKIGLEMHRFHVITAGALSHREARALARRGGTRRNDLHNLSHDTQPQTAG